MTSQPGALGVGDAAELRGLAGDFELAFSCRAGAGR